METVANRRIAKNLGLDHEVCKRNGLPCFCFDFLNFEIFSKSCHQIRNIREKARTKNRISVFNHQDMPLAAVTFEAVVRR